MAKNQNADPTAPSYVVDSFKAYQPVEKIDQVPPKLIAATTYVEKQTDGSYKANVELTFDKNVYWKQSNSSDPQIVDSLTKALDGHKSIVDDARGTPPFASITAHGGAGPAQSFNIEITGLKESGTVNILPNGFISNVSGQSTTDKITIGLVSGTYVHPVTGATITGPYAVVSWGGTPVNPIEFTNPGDQTPAETINEIELKSNYSGWQENKTTAPDGSDVITYTLEMEAGKSADVSVLVTDPIGVGSTNADISWAVVESSARPEISGTEVVRIVQNDANNNGKRSLYAAGPGTVRVNVSAGAASKTIYITVKKPNLTEIRLSVPTNANYTTVTTPTGSVTNLTINNWTTSASNALRVTGSLIPMLSDVDNVQVIWTTSDANTIALVGSDNRGETGSHYIDLEIKKAGTATIKATVDGVSASMEITIAQTRNQSGITINKTKPIPR